MPDFFKEWLLGLTQQQADELWDYIDTDEEHDYEIVEVVIQPHPYLIAAVAEARSLRDAFSEGD